MNNRKSYIFLHFVTSRNYLQQKILPYRELLKIFAPLVIILFVNFFLFFLCLDSFSVILQVLFYYDYSF